MTASPTVRPKIPRRIREKIRDCASWSRVTIVVGPTGCGKSTQVPSALLEDIGGPILCTQPRRLAVAAVARRVAEERGFVGGEPGVGSEVGYHVGGDNRSSSRTRLLFTTVGILLEELRAKGVEALSKYSVVVIDECHERSPESDVVLALAKTMLIKYPHKKVRLILMSATFDHGRYRQYFHGVPGCEHVETITMETASSFESYYSRVETLYLESIVRMLPDAAVSRDFIRSMMRNPDSEMHNGDGGKTLSQDVLDLIRSLLERLNDEEDEEGVFVVFAPTYRHLEQIFQTLKHGRRRLVGEGPERGGNVAWEIGVLHSSVDMELCLRSMHTTTTAPGRTNKRKVLLASAIADSSVTIPGVTCIIDLCRALEVRWNAPSGSARYVPKTVWASNSVCEQRKGRTGRTCPGRVFRLLPQGFFISKLENWDVPQLRLSSCRNEVLKLLCTGTGTAGSASISFDPQRLLKNCLDPPPDGIVSDAIGYLASIGACGVTKKGRAVPTALGELLAALPFLVDGGYSIVQGGRMGILHEILALRAIEGHKPSPIVHHFGDGPRNEQLLRLFYPEVDPSDPSSVNLAHLSAFLFWDVAWNTRRSHDESDRFLERSDNKSAAEEKKEASSRGGEMWEWTPELEEEHSEWCRGYHINPTAVRGVAEIIVTTLEALYLAKFEPEWLRCAGPMPAWRVKNYEPGPSLEPRMLGLVYGHRRSHLASALNALSNNNVAGALKFSMRFHGLDDGSAKTQPASHKRPEACVPFLQDFCRFGESCRKSHSPLAVPPPCKYFLQGKCARGDDCVFSHDQDEEPDERCRVASTSDPMSALVPIDASLRVPSAADWFSVPGRRQKTLLLGEGGFGFFRSLHSLGVAPAYASCLENASCPGYIRMKSVGWGSTRIFSALNATRIHLRSDVVGLISKKKINTISWNFPFTGAEEDDESHESLILETFLSLSEAAFETDQYHRDLSFAMTLQGDQFCRWKVLRSALRTGWDLCGWGEFNLDEFPGYQPRRADGTNFTANNSRFYVFKCRYAFTEMLIDNDPFRLICGLEP